MLCFLTPAGVASFTATIPLAAWKVNETLYRLLMSEQLSVYEVRTTTAEGADIRSLEAAATSGDPQAQYVLAATLAERAESGDAGAAQASVRWYRRAAEQGHGDAQVALGICLANGFGCDANPEEAARCWGEAAAGGDPDAHFYLAVAYSQGFGVGMDAVKAAGHCRIAAEKGQLQAREQRERLA